MKNKQEAGIGFTPEFLSSTGIADLLPRDLELKSNTTIMLMRNLDISYDIGIGFSLAVM